MGNKSYGRGRFDGINEANKKHHKKTIILIVIFLIVLIGLWILNNNKTI